MTIKEALEVLRKEYGCRIAESCHDSIFKGTCEGCEYYSDYRSITEALKTVLDAFGNCSELPNTSQTKFKPGDKFLLEIGEKRIGLDEYSIVGTDLYVWGSLLEKLTPYESVQAEQKKGRWIPVDDPSITGRCSVCGFESHLCEDDVYGYDYCPNCGARLEVVDE